LNRLNPLYIVVLLLVALLFLLFELSNIKSELKEQEAAYQVSQTVAKELLGYKKLYGDKNRIERSLKKILAQRSLKSAKLKVTQKRDAMLIVSDAIDLYALNSLLTKIFNGAYPVKALSIEAVDEKSAKLRLEIRW